MNEEQIRSIVTDASSSAVQATLISLGIDPSHPLEMQEHMANLREFSALFNDEDFRADQAHLRKWRLSMEAASRVGLKTTVATLFTGFITAVGLGIIQVFKTGSQP
jgi:hypothetical protein